MNQTDKNQKSSDNRNYIEDLDSLAETLKILADNEEEKAKQSDKLLDIIVKSGSSTPRK